MILLNRELHIYMQTWHIKTQLTHAVSFAKLFMVFDLFIITKTCLFKYTENFSTKFSDKNSDIFNISAQNIDCGYSLEPPRRGGSNE